MARAVHHLRVHAVIPACFSSRSGEVCEVVLGSKSTSSNIGISNYEFR